MALTAPPRPTTQVDAPAARPAVTLPRVMRAEWIKLRSVPSTTIGFLAAAALAIVLGLVFSSVGGNMEGPPGGGPAESSDPVSLSLARSPSRPPPGSRSPDRSAGRPAPSSPTPSGSPSWTDSPRP